MSGADSESESTGAGPEPVARSGRPLLVCLFVGAVCLAGAFGFFIGSIGIQALDPIGVLGIPLFQPTPVGMALYGMTVVGVLLGVLFLAVTTAARSERTSNER